MEEAESPHPGPPQGLAQHEAERRLAREGPNELPRAGRRSLLRLLGDVLAEPMLLLLLAAGTVYLVLGEKLDALILLAFASLSVVITLVQEARTERAIAALRDLSAPLALVIRDGQRRAIPAREVVRGDLLVLAEGDRVAADGWLEQARDLRIDESLLTGESVPVTKAAHGGARAEPPQPGGDGLGYAFAGTLIVRGGGLLEVAATGTASRIGGIGLSLTRIDPRPPRLRQQTRALVRVSGLIGFAISLLALVLYGLTRGDWLEATLAGIAIGMSMLPEELPVVFTIFLVMGALRMSRARVLARRGAAIEALGAATVLCADKTGTLTQNRMTVAQLRLPDGMAFSPALAGQLVIPHDFVELAGLGILACLEQPFDPMELAFHELGDRHQGAELGPRAQPAMRLRRHYALDPALLAMSQAWQGDGSGEHIVAAKGAPEAIAELCGLDEAARASLLDAATEMAGQGLRVLAIAEARWDGADLPESQRGFAFAWKGLAGLADPINPSVPEAVSQLRGAGIRVVMITGDYPATARAIAAQAGLESAGVLTGGELDRLDDAELAARVAGVSVFARVMPEQKLRIVQALKAAGEIVAMTGDGVNDAPSLRAADIGIAMGRRGAEVAREAAALVLIDDDFSAIVTAVGLGRQIYDNLQKAIAFILAVHVPIAGLALLPLLTGWPLILGPTHIALLEMVIDPVCSLAFEAEQKERDTMVRPPRRPDAALAPGWLLGWAAMQGLVVLAALAALALALRATGLNAFDQRTVIFASLVGAVVVLVWTNRSFARTPLGARSNLPLLVILVLAGCAFSMLFAVPWLGAAFHIGSLSLADLATVAAVCGALFALLALLKRGLRLARDPRA